LKATRGKYYKQPSVEIVYEAPWASIIPRETPGRWSTPPYLQRCIPELWGNKIFWSSAWHRPMNCINCTNYVWPTWPWNQEILDYIIRSRKSRGAEKRVLDQISGTELLVVMW